MRPVYKETVLSTAFIALLSISFAPQLTAAEWLCDIQSPTPIIDGSGVSIAGGLTTSDLWEGSGVVWHPRLNKLFAVHDNGWLAMLNLDGGDVTIWDLRGTGLPGTDFEGVAVGDPETNFVYIGLENPDGIIEFDFLTGQPTGRTWSLTSHMVNPSNEGLEALTFVPDTGDFGGVFYAGEQNDGQIYKFRLDLTTSNVYTFEGTIGPWTSNNGGGRAIQGLNYDRNNDVLWVLVGQNSFFVVDKTDGTVISEFPMVPGSDDFEYNNQEGISYIPDSCNFVISWDSNSGGLADLIRRYDFEGCTPECSEVECSVTEDCADGNACTADDCDGGICKNPNCDVDDNGNVGLADIMVVISKWGLNEGDPGWGAYADLDGNDNIGLADVILLMSIWAAYC